MVTIGIDNQTGEIIFEENGIRIYDPSQITYIKRHSNWKARVYELSTNLKNEIDSNVENKRTFHTRVPKIITEQEIKNKISSLYCNSYRITDYSKKSDSDINREADDSARKYAVCNATSNVFKKKKQTQELFNKKLPEFVEFYKAKDKDAEAKYYADENIIKSLKDAEYKTQYENEKNGLLKYITDDERKISKDATDCLSVISNSIIKITSNATYKSFPKNTCAVTLHLPNTSCIESRTGNILTSGKISIKQRKLNDIKNDWNLFCNGLILYIVGNVFNVNTCIQNVSISAKYTELNKAYGSNSVLDFANCNFDRNSFSNINFSNINPIDTVQAFSTGSIPSSKQAVPKQKTPKTQTSKPKSPFEIECYNELSRNSLSIIDTGLKALFSRYGKSIFESSEKNRFSSAVRDIFPKNEAEQQIVELLLANDCFSKFINISSKNDTETKIKEILSGNNLDGDVFLSNLKSMLGGN
jgi:hypothetical protein